MSSYISIFSMLSGCLCLLGFGRLIADQLNWKIKSPFSKRKSAIITPGFQLSKHKNTLQQNNEIFNAHGIAILAAIISLFIGRIAFAQVAFKDKPECEAHYNACSVTLYQYVLRAQEAEEKLWEVFCDTDVAWKDDSGLWKPLSNRGKPVMLLPAQYLGAKVEVYGPTGKKVADGIDRGELANENRAHFDITTKDLPFESRVVITRGETVECRYVLDPSKRYD